MCCNTFASTWRRIFTELMLTVIQVRVFVSPPGEYDSNVSEVLSVDAMHAMATPCPSAFFTIVDCVNTANISSDFFAVW